MYILYRNYRLGIIVLLLGLLPSQQHIAADLNLKNTVEPALALIRAAQFPDRSKEAKTAVTIHDSLVTAQEAAQQAVKAQALIDTPPAPVVVYTAPTSFYKDFIYSHESGNNPAAINVFSGACGLGQALPCSKMPCLLTDYACQDNFFTQYMLSRYGSWEAAYNFWVQMHWW